MYRHPFRSLTILLVSALLAAAVPSRAADSANQWQVTANGVNGLLELSTRTGGRINGTLLGRSVEGWLVGRHLVLIRDGESGPETWEAWLATSENVQNHTSPVLAGTYVQQRGNEPLPWFGISTIEATGNMTPPPPPLPANRTSVGTPQPTTPSESSTTPEEPQQVGVVASENQPVPPPSAAAPLLPSGKPFLAGSWQTPDGPLTIRQNGSSLVFVLPDREVSGRVTGTENLIGGFGPGCCKGLLDQAGSVIVWDNGVRWQRQ